MIEQINNKKYRVTYQNIECICGKIFNVKRKERLLSLTNLILQADIPKEIPNIEYDEVDCPSCGRRWRLPIASSYDSYEA